MTTMEGQVHIEIFVHITNSNHLKGSFDENAIVSSTVNSGESPLLFGIYNLVIHLIDSSILFVSHRASS